jgi:hypothetical protein
LGRNHRVGLSEGRDSLAQALQPAAKLIAVLFADVLAQFLDALRDRTEIGFVTTLPTLVHGSRRSVDGTGKRTDRHRQTRSVGLPSFHVRHGSTHKNDEDIADVMIPAMAGANVLF